MEFFQLALKMMLTVALSPKKNDLLLKIIKDCVSYLKRKSPCPCRCVERIFGLAYFIYLDYKIENIYNYESEDILSFFGEVDED